MSANAGFLPDGNRQPACWHCPIVGRACTRGPATPYWAWCFFGVLWGVVGTRYARFSSFVFTPGTVWSYVKDTLSLRAPRYIGHNPAGGAMIVLLLASLLVTAHQLFLAVGRFLGEGEPRQAVVDPKMISNGAYRSNLPSTMHSAGSSNGPIAPHRRRLQNPPPLGGLPSH